MSLRTLGKNSPIVVVWLRRDLRLDDHAALAAALRSGLPVLPLFIFDQRILGALKNPADRRVEFISQTLERLQGELAEKGGALWVESGDPAEIWRDLAGKLDIKAVYFNRDYEPYATQRDESVRRILEERGIAVHDFKDQVIFEKLEVEKGAGGPYTVFTPYSRKWKESLDASSFAPHVAKGLFAALRVPPMPSLQSLGFVATGAEFPALAALESARLKNYAAKRDSPAENATSRLSLHLRFGTLSVREAMRQARKSEAFLNELIWREFFMQILWNFPQVARGPFRPEYAKIQWRENKDDFAAWTEGRTGYPLVDAGMRELKATGFMHGRARMVAASFLVKHLLIDWRWGEAHFARELGDFELSSNNGNWQWVAGCGCDAAPYFRVFNPETQLKKFDPKGEYVRQWIPELGTARYPEPMIDHKTARVRALREYGRVLSRKAPKPASAPPV